MAVPNGPQYGEKTSYNQRVCLEMGKVRLLELEADSYSETSVTSLKRLKGRNPGQLKVIRDNVQTHCGKLL